jgi:hypothetical protein
LVRDLGGKRLVCAAGQQIPQGEGMDIDPHALFGRVEDAVRQIDGVNGES